SAPRPARSRARPAPRRDGGRRRARWRAPPASAPSARAAAPATDPRRPRPRRRRRARCSSAPRRPRPAPAAARGPGRAAAGPRAPRRRPRARRRPASSGGSAPPSTILRSVARSLGRYELLRPLARGGMADVFLARRRGAAGVEKRLVVKRIRPEHASNPRFVELFINEARLSVDLAHANIVPVFDFGRVGDELFLAMEYVDGRDLAAALQRAAERGAPLDPVLVAHIGAECCRGLDYAHGRAGRRLVHRDVTPRNVLLSFAGEVKLTDFGVASLD